MWIFLFGILDLSDVEALTGNRQKKGKNQDKNEEALLCTGECCVTGETAWRER